MTKVHTLHWVTLSFGSVRALYSSIESELNWAQKSDLNQRSSLRLTAEHRDQRDMERQ